VTQPLGQAGAAWNFPSIGRWGVTALPSGWVFVADFGIKQIPTGPQQISANVSLVQESLESPDRLPAYLDDQKKLIVEHIAGASIGGPQLYAFPASEEAYLLMLRHTPEGAVAMLHIQTYVRVGCWLGIITLTTPDAQLPVVRPHYDAFVRGLCILPESAEPVISTPSQMGGA
jgi:hypothetical protein